MLLTAFLYSTSEELNEKSKIIRLEKDNLTLLEENNQLKEENEKLKEKLAAYKNIEEEFTKQWGGNTSNDQNKLTPTLLEQFNQSKK